MWHIVRDLIIIIAIAVTILFVYRVYGGALISYFFGGVEGTMYLEGTPIVVTVADEPEEHRLGLSGVSSLGEFEGKLFVFSKEGFYHMWMKDMLIPIDIIWIDNKYQVVHIERNVKPDTYPKTFVSPVPARFVVEVNAYVTDNVSLAVGDKVTLPSHAVPWDLVRLTE